MLHHHREEQLEADGTDTIEDRAEEGPRMELLLHLRILMGPQHNPSKRFR